MGWQPAVGVGRYYGYGFTTDGQLVTAWRGPFNPTNNLAWDSDLGVLWLSGTTTNIFSCDLDGNHVDTLNRKGFRIYGLAYWPEDPDGCCLYILNQPGNGPPLIHKMNTTTGDTLLAYTSRPVAGATGMAGLWITNEYDVYSWVLMANHNIPPASGADRLSIYQLDARKDWFNLNVWSGVLPPEEVQDFTLTLNTTGLPDTTFEGELRFTHNAAGGQQNIGVTLRVIGPMPPNPFALIAPTNGDTIVALPLHGDTLNVPVVQFIWNSPNDPNVNDTLKSYQLFLNAGIETVTIPSPDTTIVLNLDTLGLPLWFDTPVNWWVRSTSGSDTVGCVQNYYFRIIPNAVDRNSINAPVKFGLHEVYPSPFNSRTSITFGVDRAVRTTLTAYDLLGREVGVLFDKTPEVGVYRVAWDAGILSSGVYIIRLESAGRSELRKIALIR